MKQRMRWFEEKMLETIEGYDKKLEERVEVRLEQIQRAFLSRTEKAAHAMFEEKNKIIMQAINVVNENFDKMRVDHG